MIYNYNYFYKINKSNLFFLCEVGEECAMCNVHFVKLCYALNILKAYVQSTILPMWICM